MPDRSLTFDEALDRLNAAMGAFETAAEAIQEIAASGSTLFEDAHALAEKRIDERDFGHLSVSLIQIWFALVPRGGRAPRLRLDAMQAAIVQDAKKIQARGPGGMAVLQRMFSDSPQPNLLQAVAGALVKSYEEAPQPVRPQPGSVVVMVLVLKAMIAEIDCALRRP